jgi:hypothetical protein
MPEFSQSRELPALLAWGNRCLATDPIGMEFALEEGDPALRRQLIAIQLETAANVYRAMADGAAELAKAQAAGGR